MIKAVFFDIDGTLYSHTQKRVPPGSVAALKQLQAKGIKIGLATGRHPKELYVLPEDVHFDASILLNGQLCLDENGHVFVEEPLSDERRERLLWFYGQHICPVILISRKRLLINFINEQANVLAHLTNAAVPEGVPEPDEVFYMASLVADETLDGKLRECLPGFDLVRWHDCGVDVIPPGGGKVLGITRFMERTGIAREEIMVFGDSENDRHMLEFAGIGVAMGNGSMTAKQAADYVTDGIDEDGLYHALQHFHVL